MGLGRKPKTPKLPPPPEPTTLATTPYSPPRPQMAQPKEATSSSGDSNIGRAAAPTTTINQLRRRSGERKRTVLGGA
jgi:hypothetical protein